MAIRIPQTFPALDPAHTITIKHLSGWKLNKARTAFMNATIAEMVARGGAKVMRDLQTLYTEDKSKTEAEVAKVKADPLNGYDTRTLIDCGVIAYDEKSVTSEWVDELDDDEIRFYAEAVLKIAKPALFQSADEQEAARKNA